MKTGVALSLAVAAALVLSCARARDTGTGTTEPTPPPTASGDGAPAETTIGQSSPSSTGAGTPPVATRPRGLSPEQKRDLEMCVARASAAAQADQVDIAVKNFERVWSLEPNHPYAVMYLKDYYLRRGLELYGDGLLDEAIQVWENALRVCPDDKRVQGYLERARKQVARTQQILDDNR